MTSQPSKTGVNASATHITREQRKRRQALLNNIGDTWHKFSWWELDALTDSHDLVAQVAAKYRIDRLTARRDVEGVLKGRIISL